jgi:serine/threonine protein kinase
MSDSLSAQKRVVGQYVLERRIGEGGMAEVWLARHRSLETPAAIKFLNSMYAGQPEIEARFLGEGKLQARLTQLNVHGANILPVFDYMEEEGRSYLVMRYIEGFGLDDRIRRANGPLPTEEVLSISRDVLGAMGYAHSQGVIHRDVKPSNVLLENGKRAFLMDFGIALARNVADRRTRIGAVLGTPHYMSPEQIEASRDVTPVSDIYSFGCVLYEMLTGQTPFDPHNEATDFDIRRMHVSEMPRSPDKLNASAPRELTEITLRCLAKRPGDRFPDCETILRQLGGRAPRSGTVVLDTSSFRSDPGHTVTEIPVQPNQHATSNSGTIRLPPGMSPQTPPVPQREAQPVPAPPVQRVAPRVAAAPAEVSREGKSTGQGTGSGIGPGIEEMRRRKKKKQTLGMIGAAFAAALVLSGGIAIWQHEKPAAQETVTSQTSATQPNSTAPSHPNVAPSAVKSAAKQATARNMQKAVPPPAVNQPSANSAPPEANAPSTTQPASGALRWIGSVTPNQVITFYPTGRVSAGMVRGLIYPEQPLKIDVQPAAMYDVLQTPSAGNQWELVLRARYSGDASASIRWAVAGH